MIEAFLKWWWRELRACVPNSTDGENAGKALRLTVEGKEVVGERREGRRLIPIGQLALGSSGLSEALSDWAVGLSPAETKVEIWVPQQQTLRKSVWLPAAAEENLREVMGFEMERQTPFRAQDVYFDCAIRRRDRRAKKIEVDLQVVRRSLIDPLLAGFESWRLQQQPMRDNGAKENANVYAMNFVPAGFKRSGAARALGLLALVNLGLIAGLIAIPWMEKQSQLEQLEAELDRARLAAAQAASVRDQVLAKRDAVNLLGKFKSDQPSSVGLLEEVTRRLPDSTWLQRLEVKNGKAQLQGTSTESSSLIALLEDSQMFANVQFSSPVTRQAATGRERFNVEAELIAGLVYTAEREQQVELERPQEIPQIVSEPPAASPAAGPPTPEAKQ